MGGGTEPVTDAAPLETALLEGCRQRDRSAFAALFDAYRDRVYSLAVHLGGNERLAADVTQDVFMKLWTRIDQFRREATFSTWLHRIVVNTYLDHRRAEKRFIRPDPDGSAAQPAAQARGVWDAEIPARVRAALGALSPKLRAPLVLRYLEELSYQEIADLLGVSPGTVASRLSRGHRQLAALLADLKPALRREV